MEGTKARKVAAGRIADSRLSVAAVKKAVAAVQAVPPAITGTDAGQTTYDSASIKPFATVSISDPNSGAQIETVTIVPTYAVNGAWTDPNATTDGSSIVNGTFTVSGTAAQVSSELDALAFTPSYGVVTPYGATVTTGFTITVRDTAGGTATDSTTTVIATATAPFSSLVSFSLSGNQGAEPVGSLIADANGDLFGTTSFGAGQGVYEILKTANGYASTLVMLASLGPATGYQSQAGLIADANGDLFGTTYFDGAYNDGTVFEIVKTANGYAGTPTILLNFNGTDTGANPLAGLTMDANGDLFGTTQDGGTANLGTVFEIALTPNGYASTPTILFSFGSGSNPSTASEPEGGLLVDANGNLFGTTQDGGTGNVGTVFEIAKTANGYASAPTILLSFNYTDGADPRDGLVEDAKGNLFGTAIYGGTNYDGVVFEIAKTANGYASAPAILLNFNGSDGADPQGGLIADANGDLFGTTLGGGTYGDGTVFEILNTPTGYASTPITLLSFDGANGDGPASSLTVNASGTLFGTTEGGGASGWGTAFDVTGTGFVIAKPVFSGTAGGQTTTSEAPVKIFTSVSLADSNIFGAESDTLTITYAGGGTLSGSSLLAGSAGSYTLTGSAAAITAAIEGVVFTPVAGAPASATTTSFTLTAINAPFGTVATDTTTTLTDIDPAVAPTIAVSGNTSIATASEAAVKPCAGVTIKDLNNNGADTDTLTIILSGGGTLSGAGLSSSNGTYTLTGTAASITAALDSVVFTPANGVANTTVTTGITLSDKSSASASAAVNMAISVVDTDPAIVPTISTTGTRAFATSAEALVKPLGGVIVADGNNGGSDFDTLTISLSGGGSLSGTGLSGANGTYTLTGTAAAISNEVQALVFTPVFGQANSSVTTTFTLSDKSSASATPATSSAITVTDTDAPAVSTLGGMAAGQTTTDESTIKPFATVTVTDPNAGTQQDALVITLSGGDADGRLSGTGLSYLGPGVYTLNPATPALLNAELQALVFTPAAHQVAPGSSVTTTFGLIVVNEASLVSPTNSTTTVIATAVNDAPSIAGMVANQALRDTATVKPFATATVTDPDLSVADSLTITLKTSSGAATDANGLLSGTGLTKTGTGTYVLAAASPGTLTSELEALVFTPTAHQVNQGATVSTGFTLAASQTAGGSTVSTTNSVASVVVTAAGVAPTISISGGTTITDSFDAAVKPFTGVTIADLNDLGGNTDTLVISESGLGGSSSSGPTLTGSAATINSALQNLTFTPAGSLLAANTVFGFTLTSSGYGTATVDSNAITVTSSMLIAAVPVVKLTTAAATATISADALNKEAGPSFGFADLIGTHAATASGLGTSLISEAVNGVHDFVVAPVGTDDRVLASEPHAIGSFGTSATVVGADPLGLAHVLSHGFVAL